MSEFSYEEVFQGFDPNTVPLAGKNDRACEAETLQSLRAQWGPVSALNGIRYFGSISEVQQEQGALARPLRVCVATSVRDIGCEDLANRPVNIRGKERYMYGSLNALLDATQDSGALENLVEVVGIVTDDIPGSKELCRNDTAYAAFPEERNQNWIVPGDYRLPNGRLVESITRNIPSVFRQMPQETLEEQGQRERAKANFERRLSEYASDMRADVIMSDHLMLKLEHVFYKGDYARRVINIHPAITWEGDPNQLRGKSPTRDALRRARRKAYNRTGASMHFISRELDAGPVICDGERTPILNNFTPMQLRYHNYACSKIPVMIAGLKYLHDNYNLLINTHPAEKD